MSHQGTALVTWSHLAAGRWTRTAAGTYRAMAARLVSDGWAGRRKTRKLVADVELAAVVAEGLVKCYLTRSGSAVSNRTAAK